MKKTLSVLILMAFLAVLAVPLAAGAQQGPPANCTLKRNLVAETGDTACQADNSVTIADHGLCCLMNTLYNVTNWIFVVLVALVGIFVIMGAFNYLTSAGDPEKTKNGRLYIMYAAIGLAVAFLAKAIPGIVGFVVGT